MTRLRDKATGDILVLLIAGTICSGLVLSGLAAAVFAFVHPDADLSGPARYIADITNTLIGLLAGFLAGTTTAYTGLRPERKSAPPATVGTPSTQEDP